MEGRQQLYLCRINRKERGPFTVSELRELVEQGTLTTSNAIKKEGTIDWYPIGRFSKLFANESADSGSHENAVLSTADAVALLDQLFAALPPRIQEGLRGKRGRVGMGRKLSGDCELRDTLQLVARKVGGQELYFKYGLSRRAMAISALMIFLMQVGTAFLLHGTFFGHVCFGLFLWAFCMPVMTTVAYIVCCLITGTPKGHVDYVTALADGLSGVEVKVEGYQRVRKTYATTYNVMKSVPLLPEDRVARIRNAARTWSLKKAAGRRMLLSIYSGAMIAIGIGVVVIVLAILGFAYFGVL